MAWTYSDPRLILRLGKGKPSQFILKFAVKPGDRFVIWCRVSRPQQWRHLSHQQKRLRRAIQRCGGVVVAVYSGVWGGKDLHHLARASVIAKRLQARLVAETTDRFIRSGTFHPTKRPFAQADKSELEDLAWWADGVALMTLINPDATPRTARSAQTKRGQAASGRKGGRPKNFIPGEKKRRRLEMQRCALELRQSGESYRQIAEQMKLPVMTVHGWLRQSG